MDINRIISNLNFFDIEKKLLWPAYTETTLNGDFNPKSAIISINTNTKFFFYILTNYIIRDGLSQKTISRYCSF
jgi:hypothetical protein